MDQESFKMKTDIRISPFSTIKEAMQLLDSTSQRLLLVLDEDERLLGSLSDGDIRRFILKNNTIDGIVEKAYNNNVTYCFESDMETEKIKKVLIEKKIEVMPVVNKDRRVVDYVTWEELFESKDDLEGPKKQVSLPVIIMAGGMGTRLDPFTRILPKPLIPLGNQPIIEHIMDRFRACGIEQYYLTLNHKAKIIKAYFEERTQPHRSVEFVEEVKPLGTAGSLRLLLDKIESTVFVTNCDIIVEADFAALYDHHMENNYDITLVASVKHVSIPYGICHIENGGSLAHIQEKPEYDFLVNTGLYVVSRRAVELIPADTSLDMTDLIAMAKDKGWPVGVYPVSGKSWVDVGEWSKFQEASEEFHNVSKI